MMPILSEVAPMISVRNVTLRSGVNVVLDHASATFNHFSYRADKRAPAQESA